MPNFEQPLIKKIGEVKTPKSVIILGVPYSEYKVRVKKRGRSKGPNVQTYSQVLNWLGPHSRPKVYKEWMEELNKKEIPYKFVEASGDYKVLEEKEFFRMLND
jgi:deoxyadenosine/deoxycytidine kinase